MTGAHLGTTALSIALTAGAVVSYGAFALYGAWSDGQPQAVRKSGLHPVMEAKGGVHAREEEKQDGSNRG